MIETGTRTRQLSVHIRPSQGHITRTYAADPHMSKRVSANLTFGSGRVTGSNGQFAAFALNDVVRVEGTNANNGFATVTGLDAANQAYLALDPAPTAEGPVAAVVRTA